MVSGCVRYLNIFCVSPDSSGKLKKENGIFFLVQTAPTEARFGLEKKVFSSKLGTDSWNLFDN
jgi:hypothetical protein